MVQCAPVIYIYVYVYTHIYIYIYIYICCSVLQCSAICTYI